MVPPLFPIFPGKELSRKIILTNNDVAEPKGMLRVPLFFCSLTSCPVRGSHPLPIRLLAFLGDHSRCSLKLMPLTGLRARGAFNHEGLSFYWCAGLIRQHFPAFHSFVAYSYLPVPPHNDFLPRFWTNDLTQPDPLIPHFCPDVLLQRLASAPADASPFRVTYSCAAPSSGSSAFS